MNMPVTYRTRLIAGIVMVIVPIQVLMTIHWLSTTRTLTYEREISRLNSIGRLLGNEIRKNIEKQADNEIREVLTLTAMMPDIIGVNLIDPDGIIIHSSDSTTLATKAAFTDSVIPPPQRIMVRFYPVEAESKTYSLQILHSLINTQHDLSVALRWAIFFDLLLFISALVIAWHISGYMEKPVRSATNAAEEIAAGNFDINLRQVTKDAYGNLIGALNRMAHALKELTHSMQAKVDAATGELAEKNRRLMELDTLKTEFVAVVSHELRTPLTSIIGFAKALQKDPLPPETTVEYSSIIEKEGKHLAALVEEFLDVSKIEKGSFSLNQTEVDIREVIEDARKAFPWPSKLDVDIQEEIPPVYADKWRLKRVIRNLLDNAVKHGGLDVGIWVKAHYLENHVTVSISDNGPGIPQEMQKTIFKKFYTADSSSGGSGLGLAIAKAIVEAHGGTIVCDSTPDIGTTFTFTLPVSDTGDSDKG